jgi:transcriptional regulator with XRE-family HTH domain
MSGSKEMPRRTEPHPDALKVGQRITQLCNEKKLTLETLGQRCGTGRGHISSVMHGLAAITVPTIMRIAEGLGVPPWMLFVFPKESELNLIVDRIGRLPVRTRRGRPKKAPSPTLTERENDNA